MGYERGGQLPSEAGSYRDAATGSLIVQVTNHPSVNHNLYFLTSSFTPNEDAVIFVSSRSGTPNFYRATFPHGDMVQLTDEADIHGYSAIISSYGKELLYTAGGSVRGVGIDSLEERTLAQYPDGQLGELSISADQSSVVAAMKRGKASYITVTRTDGSGGEAIFESPRTIIHPQFHPSDLNLIEYAQDPAPRIWTIKPDGTGNECLYQHDNDEFIVHETFLGEDDLIFTLWPYALKRMNLKTRAISNIANFNAWHIAGSRSGEKVLCDTVHPDRGLQLVDVASGARTTICHPNSSSGGTQWMKDRYAVAEDWKAAAAAAEKDAALSWMEMKNEPVYGPQWTHPHPSFSPTERWAAYTSDTTGHSQVYAVEIRDDQ